MIDNYEFGEIMVDGKIYLADLIILPGEIMGNWWRLEGHKLQLEDLKLVLDKDIEALVVGTGYFGMVKVVELVVKVLKDREIELIVLDTREACQIYNRLSALRKTAAALHLTC